MTGNQGKRILVVDDDEAIRKALARVLKRNDYEVAVAPDGQTALRMIRTGKPNLVLLDIMMPDLDGLGVLRRMGQIHQLRAPKVIMLTAVQDVATKIEAFMELGAVDYLTKPYDQGELLARVHRALQLRTAAEAAVEALGMMERMLEAANYWIGSSLTETKRLASDLDLSNADAASAIMEQQQQVEQMLGQGKLYVRLQSFPLQLSTFRLVEPVQEILARHRGTAQVRCDPELSDFPPVEADRKLVRRLVGILFEYSRVNSPPNQEIQISVHERSGFIHLTFKYKGARLGDDLVATLFTPFPEKGEKAQNAYPAQNLDLPLARLVALRHGGDLTYRSLPGGFLSFTASLPKAREEG